MSFVWKATGTGVIGHCGGVLSCMAIAMVTVLFATGCTESVEGARQTSAVFGVADCPAGTNVIEGTHGDDELVGTSGPDCIIGHGGDDTISGGAGDDVIAGGDGSDTLYGDQGNDEILGEAGDDTLDGGNGQDLLDGGDGDDTLIGGNGRDTIAGGAGNDVLDGANGSDTLEGGDGNDVISGANGSDTINGGDGNDTIIGGSGGDDVNGGAGVDACDGAGCESSEPAGGCVTDADCDLGQTCVTATGVCVYCLDDAACDDGDPSNGVETCVPTEGCQGAAASLLAIMIEPALATLAVGESIQLVAIGFYSDGTTADITDAALWASSDAVIATVSNGSGSSGLVTGTSAGTTFISATLGPVTANVAVTVTAPELVSLQVTPSSATIAIGAALQFMAVATYSDGTTADVTETALWSSSDDAVATVSNSPGSTGLATGVDLGTASIWATLGPVTDESTVTVSGAVLESLAVVPESVSIPVGAALQFTAIGFYSDGSTVDVTDSALWTSDAPVVATVSTNGQVMGNSVGTAVVSAQYAGFSYSVVVEVTDAELVSLEVLPASAMIAVGTTQQFTAIGLYSDGTTYDMTDVVTWSSDDATVLTVSMTEPGLVVGHSPGSANVMAHYSGIFGTTTVDVTDAVLEFMQIFPNPATVAVGENLQLTAHGYFSDGSVMDMTSDVLWTSDNVAVASVSVGAGSEGLVSGNTVGMAVISAEFMGFFASADVTVVP